MRHPLISTLTSAALAALAALAPAADLIPFGSIWDYMHPIDGVDPAVADPDFDGTWFLDGAGFAANYDGPPFAAAAGSIDGGSAAAPFGYGSIVYIDNTLGGIATPLNEPPDGSKFTAYFRHDFELAEDVAHMAIDLIVDDGAVIYLDGLLLAEVNFSGDDTYTAHTGGTIPEDELRLLRAGLGGLAARSTLAVSVHQTNGTSSDLGFDLRLGDDGTATLPMGTVDLGGGRQTFFLAGAENGWLFSPEFEFLLDGADGGVIRSQEIALAGETDVLAIMEFDAEEISVASNFEADDFFTAYLEVEDGAGAASVIRMIPAAYDSDGDGALAGDEFGPGIDPAQSVVMVRPLVARVPDDVVSAVVVVEARNDSTTEMFEFRDTRFTHPPGTVLGQADFGAPADIGLLAGPGEWSEIAPRQFSLNDGVNLANLLSEVVDLTGRPLAAVSLLLNASETSTTSNFEAGDSFAAFAEVVTVGGGGVLLPLVSGGTDADSNNVLSGAEFAPGAGASERVDAQFPLFVRLPPDAVAVQILIVAENNAQSETFTVSELLVRAAPPVAPEFGITGVTRVAGAEVQITWGSEAGAVYDLQFSPDLSNGSFGTVETLTATGPSTAASHDPGNADAGFFRVRRRP